MTQGRSGSEAQALPPICAVLRRLRESAGLTQAMLGAAIDRPQRWVSAVENGTEPSSEQVHRWAMVCGTTGVVAFSLAGLGDLNAAPPEDLMLADERLPEHLREAMRGLYLSLLATAADPTTEPLGTAAEAEPTRG